MSFKDVQAEDLIFAANEDLNLDLPENATKPVALAAILEAGVTWEQACELSPTIDAYDQAIEKKKKESALNVVTSSQVKESNNVPAQTAEKPRPEDVVATTQRPAKTLIKMDRQNPSFQIRGYKFTQENPFALVTEEDAEFLVDLNDGFYYATPREAAEFYG